ncbi:MAG: methyltransferase domain-containing protein [bacterium]|nr:methyltransferase domain-containing protein [bacterium]
MKKKENKLNKIMISGLPGSGKSTLGRLIDGHPNCFFSQTQDKLLTVFYNPSAVNDLLAYDVCSRGLKIVRITRPLVLNQQNKTIKLYLELLRKLLVRYSIYYRYETYSLIKKYHSDISAQTYFLYPFNFDFNFMDRKFSTSVFDDTASPLLPEDIIDSYFSSYHSAWKDSYIKQNDIKYYVNFGPTDWESVDFVLKENMNIKIIYLIRSIAGLLATMAFREMDGQSGHESEYNLKNLRLNLFKLIKDGYLQRLISTKQIIEQLSKEYPDKIMIINFEELIDNHGKKMREICEFADIPFDEILLAPTFNKEPVSMEYLAKINDDEVYENLVTQRERLFLERCVKKESEGKNTKIGQLFSGIKGFGLDKSLIDYVKLFNLSPRKLIRSGLQIIIVIIKKIILKIVTLPKWIYNTIKKIYLRIVVVSPRIKKWNRAAVSKINRNKIKIACPYCGESQSNYVSTWSIVDHYGLFDDNEGQLKKIYLAKLPFLTRKSWTERIRKKIFDSISGSSFVEYHRCEKCDLVYQNYPHNKDHVQFYYKELYRLQYQEYDKQSGSVVFGRTEQDEMQDYVDHQKSIGNYFLNVTKLKPGARILDSGCADGILCHYLKERGMDSYGIDPSLPMINYAKTHLKLDNVLCGNYNPETFPEEHFDGIITHHVAEHVVDIDEYFSALHKHLKKGSFLLIQVPCVDTLKSEEDYQRVLHGDHIYCYSEKFLREILKNKGFTIKECKKTPGDFSRLNKKFLTPDGKPVWADDPLSISIVARKK